MSTTYNPATITYEQMMALFLENREQMKESAKEFDRRIKETNQQIAKLGNRLGELVESMVEGEIIQMFKDLGYDFDVCNKSFQFRNKDWTFMAKLTFFLKTANSLCSLKSKRI